MKKKFTLLFILIGVLCLSLFACTNSPNASNPVEKTEEEKYNAMKDVKIELTATDAFTKDCLVLTNDGGTNGKVVGDLKYMYSYAKYAFSVPESGYYIISVRYFADPLTKWGAFINEISEYKLDFIGDRTFRTLVFAAELKSGENSVKIRNTMGNGYFAYIDKITVSGIKSAQDALIALNGLKIKEGQDKLVYPKIYGFNFNLESSGSSVIKDDGTINQLPYDKASPMNVELKIAASRGADKKDSKVTVTVPVIYPAPSEMIKTLNKNFSIKKGETRLRLEDMTEKGFSLSIGYTSNPNIISYSGFINAEKEDKTAELKLRLVKNETGEEALSEAFTVAVPGLGYEVNSNDFFNPLGEGEDPFINFIDGKYYHIQAQHGGANARLEIICSDSFIDYRTEGFKTIYSFSPYSTKAWNSSEIWGPFPMIKWSDGHYYIYYAASNGNNNNHRQGVLKSKTADPMGEYEDLGIINTSDSNNNLNPSVSNTVWAIGATTFKGNDGNTYLVWSGWRVNGDQWPQRTYMAKIRSPKDIGARVLISSPTYDWEGCDKGTPLMEGQAVFNVNGKIFMLFSADSSWAGRYSLGIMEYRGGTGDYLNKNNWVKRDKPIFVSTKSIEGPGGASLVPTKDGNEWWLLYHSSKYKGSGWDRAVSAKLIYFDENGFPVLDSPVPFYEKVRNPSGDNFVQPKVFISRASEAEKEGNVKLIADGNASGGTALNNFTAEGDKATFTLNVEKSGYYTILIRYAAVTDEITHRLTVNSSIKPMESYVYLGKDNFFTLSAGSVLKMGENKISLSYVKGLDVKIDFIAAYYSGE